MNTRVGSFPLQLLTFLVLPLLILLTIVSFGGVALHQSAMRNQSAEHNIHTVRGAAASLSEHLDHQRELLIALAEHEHSDGQSPRIIVEVESGLEAVFDGGVAIYDSDGTLMVASTSAEWPSSEEIVATLSTTSNSDETLFLPLVRDGQNATSVTVITPVELKTGSNPDVSESFLVAGAHSLIEFGLEGVLQGLHTGSTTVYIITSNGRVLYHSDPSMVGKSLANQTYLTAAMRGGSGSDFRDDAEGRRVITTFAPIQPGDWILVQDEVWTDTISPLMRYSQAAPLALLPGLLVAAGAVWFGIWRIVRPLRQLEGRARDLAWGDFSSIEEPVGGIEEIARLQGSLQHLAERVRTAQAGMRHYIRAITQAQEDERARVARELHDQTIQALVALDHREQMLKRHLTDDPAGGEVLTDLRAMTAQTIDDTRRIIAAMRPVYLEDLGLVPALRMLARDLDVNNGIAVSFEKQGTPHRLSQEQEMALYRVAQEAMNNVRYHSQAKRTWLTIQFGDDQVVVLVRDDGRGFEAPSHASDLSSEGHFGLMGMYERAALIGGHLQIHSNVGEGTTVSIRAPHKSSEDQPQTNSAQP